MTSPVAAGAVEMKPSPASGFPWLAALWAGGAGLVWSRFLIGAWRLTRLRRRSAACDEEWERALSGLRGAMALAPRKRIALRISESTIPPMAWGVFSSTILLPASAGTWTAGRRTAVLAHELAHVRRRDAWSQLLAQGALGLYWFHPLVWYATGRMRLERERASDDHVINLGASPQDYADHLLAVTRGMGGRLSHAAITMAASSHLEVRLKAILDPAVRRQDVSRLARAGLTLVVALTILISASARIVAAGEQPLFGAAEETGEIRVATEESRAIAQPEVSAPSPREPEAAVPTVPGAQDPMFPAGESERERTAGQASRALELLVTLLQTDEGQLVERPLPEGEVREGLSTAAQDETVTELPLVGQDVLDLISVTRRSPEVENARAQEDERRVRRIRPGDVVRIYVYGEPELSVTVRVQPDGLLSMPLLQGLIAEGLTPSELADVIRGELGRYVQAPNVTVVLESVESYRVYVTGSVRRPGALVSETPINVLQALALSGGFTDFANRRGIRIVRIRAGEEDRIFEFDYEAVVSGASPGQNIRLEQDDVIIVP